MMPLLVTSTKTGHFNCEYNINSDSENQIEDGEFLGRDSDFDW